jgi:hypothetical protein
MKVSGYSRQHGLHSAMLVIGASIGGEHPYFFKTA